MTYVTKNKATQRLLVVRLRKTDYHARMSPHSAYHIRLASGRRHDATRWAVRGSVRVAPQRTPVWNASRHLWCRWACLPAYASAGTHPSAVSLGSWRPPPAIVVTAQPCHLGLCTGRGRSDQGASHVSHLGDDKHVVPTPAPLRSRGP
jgi:hypothetical protein